MGVFRGHKLKKKHEGQDQNSKCNICCLPFTSWESIKIHFNCEYIHSSRKFTCQHCGGSGEEREEQQEEQEEK